MEFETSDILGHKTMPIVQGKQGWLSFTKSQVVWASIISLGLYIIGIRMWRHYLQWRERRYRLATRRRHGIPDSDMRPFNVAYSEAVLRAREEEGKKQQKPKPALRPRAQAHESKEQEQHLRNRSGVSQGPVTGIRSSAIPVPGGYNTALYESDYPSQTRNVYNFAGQPTAPKQSNSSSHHVNGFTKQDLVRQRGYYDITDVDALSDGEGKKRSFDHEEDEEHESKKTRVEGDELIDGDDDAEFDDLAPKRGSKRNAHDEEDNEAFETKKSRGKRARKVSSTEVAPQDDMDVDDEEADEITELKPTLRGKKRDRAEAGSTFGGDEENSDLDVEAAEGEEKSRRRRKRRTVAKRKSEASFIRGRQYGMNGEDEHSEKQSDEDSPGRISARRKRKSKRTSDAVRRNHEYAASDVSMDESTTSTKSKVRNIGDEWESNGIKYKIGPNGQRLRQTLVKKARQKFIMPKDSQHPDRTEHLNICIETWLTEEEYQEAKAQHILAWQDSPRKQDSETERLILNTSHSQSPSAPHGKSLLWSSSVSATPTASPVPMSPGLDHAHRTLRSSAIGITPASPFIEPVVLNSKRIAASSRTISFSSSIHPSGGLSDSTNGSPRTPVKSLSKWEKQEMEARAMMKIREATQKKEAHLRQERERAEREAAEKQRLEKEKAEKERADKERLDKERAEGDRKAKEAAASSAIPLITVTAPTLESIGGSSQPQAQSQSTAATPVAATVPAPATASSFNFFGNKDSSAPKVADGSSQPSGRFALPPKSTFTPSATPQPSVNGTTAPAAATAPASKNHFSFGPPPAATTTTSTSTSAPKAPAMSFNFSAGGGDQQKAESSNTNASTAGTSLFSRLGPQVSDNATASEATKTPAPLFRGQLPSTTVNPFGVQPSSTSPAAAAAGAQASTATTAPKFNFGFSAAKAPTTTTTSATSAFPTATSNSSSSLTGALGSDKPAGLNFSFKVPGMPASATNSGANGNGTTGTTSTDNTTTPSSTPIAQPKFSFGGGSSGFGAPAAKPAENKEEAAKAPAVSAFGGGNTTSVFGNSSGTTSVFGGNSTGTSSFGGNAATKSTSVFGNTNTTSAFGTTTAFGAQAHSQEPTKSVFGNTSSTPVFGGSATGTSGFGNNTKTFSFGGGDTSSSTTPATSSSTPATTTAPKPLFSFGVASTPGTSTGTSTPATGPAPLTFKFGAASTPSASTTTAPQASPFGATPGQSVFGNLNAGNSAFGGANVFGTSTTPAAAQK